MTYLFTSESVSEGHPDKVADLISDSVVDMILKSNDKSARCACETLVTTDTVVLAGEVSEHLDFDNIEFTVRDCIKNIGYTQEGFDWSTVKITNLLHEQSSDIRLGTDDFGAGDQGLMFGYACKETDTLMPSAIYWSHRIVEELSKYRHDHIFEWLEPDAKSQVTFEYDELHRPIRIAKIVCSTQHKETVSIDLVRKSVEEVIRSVLPENYIDKNTQFYINPTGRFVIGGPVGDTGLTGRKIIVDTYGGYSPHGGGAFSGKDPTKVDRSAAYMCRYLAKNIVNTYSVEWAQCQLSYAIGIKEPMSFNVITSDSSLNKMLTEKIMKEVDLTPGGIIDRFDLFRPIYTTTTNYGHFGKNYLPWEQLDLF